MQYHETKQVSICELLTAYSVITLELVRGTEPASWISRATVRLVCCIVTVPVTITQKVTVYAVSTVTFELAIQAWAVHC